MWRFSMVPCPHWQSLLQPTAERHNCYNSKIDTNKSRLDKFMCFNLGFTLSVFRNLGICIITCIHYYMIYCANYKG